MEKIELSKERLNKLVNNCKELLLEAYEDVSEDSIRKNLNLWAQNKKRLYDVISKSEFWNEKELCLVIKSKVYRKIKLNLLRDLFNCYIQNHQISLDLKKQSLADGLYRIINTFDNATFNGIVSQDELDRVKSDFISSVSDNIKDYSDEKLIETLNSTLFESMRYKTICIAYTLLLKYNVRKGQKWNKVINKILTGEKLDIGKTDLFNIRGYEEIKGVKDYLTKNASDWYLDYYYNYNQFFTILSDNITPAEYDDIIYISINPIDYLNQSQRTTGWSSCHNLNGCYCASTFTMLTDSSTLIAYTLPENPDCDYAMQNKKTRQSLFVGCSFNTILQNSMYPNKDMLGSQVVRETLEKIFAEHLNKPNVWVKNNSIEDIYDDEDYLGYKDYEVGAPFVNVRLKDTDDKYAIFIGNEAYSVDDPNEMVTEHDTLSNNFNYCACCEERRTKCTYLRYYDCYVCENCLSEYYVWCNDIEDYRHIDDAIYLEDLQEYVSENANYNYCEHCGCYYSTDYIKEIDGVYYCEDCIESLCLEISNDNTEDSLDA